MRLGKLGFSFHEVMEGTLQRDGESFDRPFRFELEVRAPDVLGFFSTAVGEAIGRVRIDGLAKDAPARGTLELSPLRHGRIRYTFTFPADDGNTYKFDGKKTITGLTRRRGWTLLPGAVYRDDGTEYGKATLRFSFPRHLPGLLRSVRFRPAVGRAAADVNLP
jgi:hypothetical protein